MATRVPIPGVNELVTTPHHHPLPLCKGLQHHRTCNRRLREAGCKRVRVVRPDGSVVEFAYCVHFHIP